MPISFEIINDKTDTFAAKCSLVQLALLRLIKSSITEDKIAEMPRFGSCCGPCQLSKAKVQTILFHRHRVFLFRKGLMQLLDDGSMRYLVGRLKPFRNDPSMKKKRHQHGVSTIYTHTREKYLFYLADTLLRDI